MMQRILSALDYRINNLIRRAVITRVDASQKFAVLQVETTGGAILDDVEYRELYGYTSTPHVGAEVLLLSLGGRGSHPIAICASDRRYRKTGWAEGEVGLYTSEGDYLRFKNGRVIEVIAGAALNVTAPQVTITASTKVALTTPVVECSGNLTVGGSATITGAMASASLATTGAVVAAGGVTSGTIPFATHKHGGVQTGAGVTGGPQ